MTEYEYLAINDGTIDVIDNSDDVNDNEKKKQHEHGDNADGDDNDALVLAVEQRAVHVRQRACQLLAEARISDR